MIIKILSFLIIFTLAHNVNGQNEKLIFDIDSFVVNAPKNHNTSECSTSDGMLKRKVKIFHIFTIPFVKRKGTFSDEYCRFPNGFRFYSITQNFNCKEEDTYYFRNDSIVLYLQTKICKQKICEHKYYFKENKLITVVSKGDCEIKPIDEIVLMGYINTIKKNLKQNY